MELTIPYLQAVQPMPVTAYDQEAGSDSGYDTDSSMPSLMDVNDIIDPEVGNDSDGGENESSDSFDDE